MNLVSSHLPEVDASCSYSAKRQTCMSVTQCKVSSCHRVVSVIVAIELIEKMGNFNF